MAVTENGDGETAPIPSSDVGSPLYIHPTENAGSVLVSVPSDGLGYRSWRRSVLRALSVKNKLGFITGEIKMPQAGSPDFRQWERCDDMVTSWIPNSLVKEISDSIEYINDSTELWKELEDRYDQANGAQLYLVQREISGLSQGSLDITGYYTKMKKIWEELNTLSAKVQCTCVCVCGAKESLYKAEQDRRLIQFLMGLNEVYTVVSGSILMMNPLPNLAQAFSILVQDEKQMEMRPRANLPYDSSALNVGSGSSEGIRSFKTNYGASSSNYSQGNRSRPYCDYCRIVGHVKAKCYRLIGYPTQDKNKGNFNYRGQQTSHFNRQGRDKGVVENVHADSVDTMSIRGDAMGNEGPKEQGVSLSKEQYNQLLGMMQQYQDQNTNTGAINFAGPFNEEASGDW